jgi:spore maturation protein CgeB
MLTKHPSYIPFELMACGCPVISNYNQATAWLFKDGENSVLTELTISSICEKIEMLMSDESKRQRIALQANRMLVRSNWEGELEKIYDFMRHPSRYKKTQ